MTHWGFWKQPCSHVVIFNSRVYGYESGKVETKGLLVLLEDPNTNTVIEMKQSVFFTREEGKGGQTLNCEMQSKKQCRHIGRVRKKRKRNR